MVLSHAYFYTLAKRATGTRCAVRYGRFVIVVLPTFSSAVTFCGIEHGLLLESVNSTTTCVGWLAVAECRPGPLT